MLSNVLAPWRLGVMEIRDARGSDAMASVATLSASIRARNAVAIMGLFIVVIGPIPYLFAFLFAYAFSEDPITPVQHMFFLIAIAAIAVVIALVATPFVRASAAIPTSQAIRLSILISLAMNLTVVGIGSIVSALNADQNSVTAEYSLTTDVLLAAGLLGSAAVAGWIAFQHRPR
jgi:hypothetical protein